MRLGSTSWMALAVLIAIPGHASAATATTQPLPVEPIPAVRELPTPLPADWLLVRDLNGNGISEGRVVLVDIGPGADVRGQVSASYLAGVRASSTRPELYIAETFYSRAVRGERSDVITIWDTRSLKPVGEIALPTGKRAIFFPFDQAFQLANDDRWAMVYNFTPASSVSVVDLVSKSVLSDVDIPGCALVYPTVGRNFATLCGDGTLLNVALDEQGKVLSSEASKAFNDIDSDPMFMDPAMVGRTAWFVSFKGTLRQIDLSAAAARVVGDFAIPEQPGGNPQWRPGGMQVIAADVRGRLYVLMNPEGKEGSHKDGGTEIWMVDPATKSVLRRIPLKVRAISIVATRESAPKIAALGIDRGLHVYDPETGELTRTIAAVGNSPVSMATLP